MIPHLSKSPGVFRSAATLVVLAITAAAAHGAETDRGLFSRGVVAADHPLASEAGAEILRKGGNVVDAAVATSFALSVVRPESCGLGGGGFMLIWNAETQSGIALDYRERAPRRATRTMFQGIDPAVPAEATSRMGGLAAAIPGNVAGLCYALEHYGTLDLPTVLAPAIRLAKEGTPLDAVAVRSRRETLLELERLALTERFASLRSMYLGDGAAGEEGTRFDSPLDDVLTRIAAEGPAGFYEGEVGRALLATVQGAGGVWTKEDLAPERLVVERHPLRTKLGATEVLTMPPPSSGGVVLIEVLHILEAHEQQRPLAPLAGLPHNGVEYIHRVTEASKHAFADRAEYLGDTDFIEAPISGLTSRIYARRIAAKIDPLRTQPIESYGRSLLPDDGGTSHFSILDAEGNAVACTETINTGYGSFVVEPRFGVVLNNEMDDFTARPGEANAFGLIQSERNAVAPGKKPLSSMTPTIVIRDGRAEFVVGGSGGPKIISGTLETLLNVTRFGMSAEMAVSSPRFHHQWQPNVLWLERGLLAPLSRPLEERGHQVEGVGGVGVVQAALRRAEGLEGASDPRKGGAPRGW